MHDKPIIGIQGRGMLRICEYLCLEHLQRERDYNFLRCDCRSACDATVPAALRGKYLAFAERGSAGVEHLRALRDAGLTHVHLLPVYDFGSVPEREEDRREPGVSSFFWRGLSGVHWSCNPGSDDGMTCSCAQKKK